MPRLRPARRKRMTKRRGEPGEHLAVVSEALEALLTALQLVPVLRGFLPPPGGDAAAAANAMLRILTAQASAATTVRAEAVAAEAHAYSVLALLTKQHPASLAAALSLVAAAQAVAPVQTATAVANCLQPAHQGCGGASGEVVVTTAHEALTALATLLVTVTRSAE